MHTVPSTPSSSPVRLMFRPLGGMVLSCGFADASMLSFERGPKFDCARDLWFLVGRGGGSSMACLSNSLSSDAAGRFAAALAADSSWPQGVRLDGKDPFRRSLDLSGLCSSDEALSALNLFECMRTRLAGDRKSAAAIDAFAGHSGNWRGRLMAAVNFLAEAADQYVQAVSAPIGKLAGVEYSADPGDCLEYCPAMGGSSVHEYRSNDPAGSRIVVPGPLEAPADSARLAGHAQWRVFRRNGMLFLGHFGLSSGKCDRLFDLSRCNGRFRTTYLLDDHRQTAVFPADAAALFRLTAGLEYEIIRRESGDNGTKYIMVRNDRNEEVWIDERRLRKDQERPGRGGDQTDESRRRDGRGVRI